MKFFLTSLLLFFQVFPALSSGIQGVISNVSGEPVPFATIYVAAIHHGTTANDLGEYQLALQPGEYEVRIQYLGYKTVLKNVTVGDDFQTLDVELEEQQYNLPEVIVSSSGEDPAYYIMRRAIGLSQYYLNQVSEYTCQVYLKGSGVLTRIPALMRRQFEREGVEQDRYFVTETISEVRFRLPSTTETRVLSTRSSGSDNDTSPMSFVTMSLYRDINGIISPLSRSAFHVYRFVLEGSFMENGQQVNRIRVEPRRAGPDLYSGHIHIRDGSWNLHSVDLRVEQSFFSIQIRQVYNPVGEGVWMPVSHDFDIDVSIMGLELNYKYLASVSNYEITLNPGLDHDFYLQAMSARYMLPSLGIRDGQATGQRTDLPGLARRGDASDRSKRQQRIDELMAKENLTNREMRRMNRLIRRETRDASPRPSLEIREFSMEIDDSARTRSSIHWEENRPVPLTPGERESFGEKDPENDADTLESKDRSLFSKVAFGNNYQLSEQTRLNHGGLLSLFLLDYTTVDGFSYSQRLRFTGTLPRDRSYSVNATGGWGFASGRAVGSMSANFSYHPFRRARAGISGGRVNQDFAQDNGLNRTINTFASLFLKDNQLKLFEKDYISVFNEIDVANGLVLFTSAEYSKRRPLENYSDFYITGPSGNQFTPNFPPIESIGPSMMPEHTSFITEARLSYTHRHYFMRQGNRKIMMYSRYPTLGLSYQGGWKGIMGSDTQFARLEASIDQRFDVRLVGNFRYRLTAGRFLNKESLFAPDYRHFPVQPFLIADANNFDRFRTIDLYRYNSSEEYLTGHFRYEHARILLKRLPFMANTLIREQLFFNSLVLPDQKPVYEIGYGLNQLFLFFNVEVVTGFRGASHNYTGIRLSLPLGTDSAEIRL